MESTIEESKKNKNGKGMLVALIISIIIIVALAGYICYDKVLSDGNTTEKTSKSTGNKKDVVTNKDKNGEESEEKTSNEKDSSQTPTSPTAPTPKCTGTYYGEVSGTSANGLSYDYRHTYTLNADGTFELKIDNASGTQGVYSIIGNTIALTGAKHTTGPIDQDTQYATTDYIIADDCSYIVVDAGDGVTFRANKR